MTDWYSYVELVNNTLTNRNILLTRLTIDPDISQYNPLAVNFIDSYTIMIQFGNVISSWRDLGLIQTIIYIIFNGAAPDIDNPRNVTTDTDPTPQHDFYDNFAIGSDWLNVVDQMRFECVDNTINAAIWRVIPYINIVGFGTGTTGTYPIDGSILQYDSNSKVWISQPGKFQSITVGPASMVSEGPSGPTLATGMYLFSSGLVQQMYGSVVMSNDYLENSDIIFRVGFETTSSAPGDVEWGINYTWANIDDVFPLYTGITATHSTNSLTNKYITTEFVPISGTAKNILSTVKYIVYRNGTSVNDTYPDDVSLLYVSVSYNTNGMGSSQLSIK